MSEGVISINLFCFRFHSYRPFTPNSRNCSQRSFNLPSCIPRSYIHPSYTHRKLPRHHNYHHHNLRSNISLSHRRRPTMPSSASRSTYSTANRVRTSPPNYRKRAHPRPLPNKLRTSRITSLPPKYKSIIRRNIFINRRPFSRYITHITTSVSLTTITIS